MAVGQHHEGVAVMKYSEVYDVLVTTGLPVVYDHWETGDTPDLPFLVYAFPSNNDFIADGTNYVSVVDLEVYLYTERKNLTVEKQVEDVLSQYWVYTKQSEYWEGEDVQETIYMTQVVVEYDPVSNE